MTLQMDQIQHAPLPAGRYNECIKDTMNMFTISNFGGVWSSWVAFILLMGLEGITCKVRIQIS